MNWEEDLVARVISQALEIANLKEAPANANALAILTLSEVACYCRREDIPPGLECITAAMLAESFSGRRPIKVKEGDIELDYQEAAQDFRPLLQEFRRL